ncbi:polyprotein [Gossypium australe]|uniref:Polyprotein n=1 Tax=Gossypium australe TaxID=47621 RepID=A0A5B6WFF0_9ROSI|nr:polyprotein [Gossypium australe]
MSDLDSKKWLEAIKSVMQSMYDNQVWTLIDPPEGTKTIGCKWVFKKKTDMDSKDVYMTQPEGFVQPDNYGKVCKLQRSIYGLK